MDRAPILSTAPAAWPDAWQTYRRLLAYLRPHRGMFALGLLGAMLFSLSMVSFAGFAKVFGDGTFENQDPRTIVWLPLALIALFFFRGLGDFTQTYCMGYVGRQIVKVLRAQVFERIVNLPIGYYDRSSAATLLSRLTYNTEQIGQATTASIVVTVREALTILGSLIWLFVLNTRLTLIALTMGPLVVWLVNRINRRRRRSCRRSQDSTGDVTRVALVRFEPPRHSIRTSATSAATVGVFRTRWGTSRGSRERRSRRRESSSVTMRRITNSHSSRR